MFMRGSIALFPILRPVVVTGYLLAVALDGGFHFHGLFSHSHGNGSEHEHRFVLHLHSQVNDLYTGEIYFAPTERQHQHPVPSVQMVALPSPLVKQELVLSVSTLQLDILPVEVFALNNPQYLFTAFSPPPPDSFSTFTVVRSGRSPPAT